MKAERTLGPPVIGWLAEQRWSVYQEVDAVAGCADIVAVSGPLLAVVELKLVMSWDLLDQAIRWRPWAHAVWVATPPGRRTSSRVLAERVFAERGIGVLTVEGGAVDVRQRPAFNRRADAPRVRAKLCEEHKSFAAAGSASCRRWTTFKATRSRIERFVAANEGCLLGDAVAAVEHHYPTDALARAQIARLIRIGVIETIRVAVEGRRLRLYAATACSASDR